MGFDEFQAIETSICKLEERLLPELRDQQRTTRRKLLKEGTEQALKSYWDLLKSQTKEENDLLRKISKNVVAHYKVGADFYQGWMETYVEKAENRQKLV